MTEMLQKTENVAKNVANENSQDLTEQWKKGELPSGWYYVRLIRGEYRIDLYINGKKEWIDCPDNIIDAVVRKVPSYDELQNMNKAVNECKGDLSTIGIVKAKDTLTDTIKYYIGVGKGENQQFDEDLIVAGGAPFYPDTIKELEK